MCAFSAMIPRILCLLVLLALGQSNAGAQYLTLISDINGRYGSTHYHERVGSVIENIVAARPDLVISAGDMVAGQKKSLSQQQIDLMWQEFDRVVRQPLASAGIDIISTPGNHDGSALPGFEQETERYHQHWQDKHPDLELTENSNWPRRYAAWLGNTLIVAIDGTLPGRLQTPDIELLNSTLSQFREQAKTVMVISHLPMWPFARGREKEIINDPGLQALLVQYKVNFFISGHHHVFYPGVDDAGVVHLSVGALGGNARKFTGQTKRQPFSFVLLKICGEDYGLSARKAPDFTLDVLLSDLPETINGPMGRLTRLDLARGSVKSHCEKPD
jgi:hypothetical protein